MREVVKVGHRRSPCDGWCPQPKALRRSSACEVLRWHSPSRRFVTALHFSNSNAQPGKIAAIGHVSALKARELRSSRQQTNGKHKAAKTKPLRGAGVGLLFLTSHLLEASYLRP